MFQRPWPSRVSPGNKCWPVRGWRSKILAKPDHDANASLPPDLDNAPVKASHCDDADDEPFLPSRVDAVRLFRGRRTIVGRRQHAFLRDTRDFLFGFHGDSSRSGPHIVGNDQQSTSKAPLEFVGSVAARYVEDISKCWLSLICLLCTPCGVAAPASGGFEFFCAHLRRDQLAPLPFV